MSEKPSFEQQLFWSALPSRYGELVGQGRPRRFLILLSVLAWLLAVALVLPGVGGFWTRFVTTWDQLPAFAVVDGSLRWHGPLPYTRQLAPHLYVAVAAPNSAAAQTLATPGRAVLLLGSHALYEATALGTALLLSYPPHGTYAKAALLALLHPLYIDVLLVGPVLLLLIRLATVFWRAALTALLAWGVARLRRQSPDWRDAWAVGAFAWGLPTIADALNPLLGIPPLILWLVAVTLALAGGARVFPRRAGQGSPEAH